MIYNNTINATNCSILALSPFTTTTVNVGEQGLVGLSGPNVELIAFNSGDFDFFGINDDVSVGLGVAIDNNSPVDLSALGVVISHQCELSNFEAAYSGNVDFISTGSRIIFRLIILRAAANDGSDYTVPTPIIAFTTTFVAPLVNNADRSRNILNTTPTSIVFPGDRLVLRVTIIEIFSEIALTVGASVSCTPSI